MNGLPGWSAVHALPALLVGMHSNMKPVQKEQSLKAVAQLAKSAPKAPKAGKNASGRGCAVSETHTHGGDGFVLAPFRRPSAGRSWTSSRSCRR